MATRFDKSKDLPAPAAKPRSHDYSFDPLPVPDVEESDSDTSWGFFQSDSQVSDSAAAPQEPEAVEDEEVRAQVFYDTLPQEPFDDTVPSALGEPGADQKKP